MSFGFPSSRSSPRVCTASLKWCHSHCVFWMCLFERHARENNRRERNKIPIPIGRIVSTQSSLTFRNLPKIAQSYPKTKLPKVIQSYPKLPKVNPTAKYALTFHQLWNLVTPSASNELKTRLKKFSPRPRGKSVNRKNMIWIHDTTFFTKIFLDHFLKNVWNQIWQKAKFLDSAS